MRIISSMKSRTVLDIKEEYFLYGDHSYYSEESLY